MGKRKESETTCRLWLVVQLDRLTGCRLLRPLSSLVANTTVTHTCVGAIDFCPSHL